MMMSLLISCLTIFCLNCGLTLAFRIADIKESSFCNNLNIPNLKLTYRHFNPRTFKLHLSCSPGELQIFQDARTMSFHAMKHPIVVDCLVPPSNISFKFEEEMMASMNIFCIDSKQECSLSKAASLENVQMNKIENYMYKGDKDLSRGDASLIWVVKCPQDQSPVNVFCEGGKLNQIPKCLRNKSENVTESEESVSTESTRRRVATQKSPKVRESFSVLVHEQSSLSSAAVSWYVMIGVSAMALLLAVGAAVLQVFARRRKIKNLQQQMLRSLSQDTTSPLMLEA